MNCLCCGKPLSKTEAQQWHLSCVKRFFGTREVPEIIVDNALLEELADSAVGQGLTVPGVQKKLSLHLLSEGDSPRLTLVNYPTGYILKPQDEEFAQLPEAEHLVMSMAEIAGIAVVPHGLVNVGEELAYITRRVDRIVQKDEVSLLAMEDFCQLDYRLTRDKYRGSYERCAKIIRRHSSRVGVDVSEFFMRVIFSFLVGNSDMHLKNFSLLETTAASGEYVLSPAYDMLPVNVLMPEDEEEMALTVNGKKRNLHKKDFLLLAESAGVSAAAAERMISFLLSHSTRWEEMVEVSLLSEELKGELKELMRERRGRFVGIRNP